MTSPTIEEQGHAFLEPPDEVVAGEWGTWRLTVRIGRRGLAVGGTIRVATDTDTDWGTPQFTDPSAAEFMTIQAPEGVRIGARVDGVWSLRIAIAGRAMRPDESIAIIYGDRSGGGPGSRAQTFAEDRRVFRVEIDTAGDGKAVVLQSSPSIAVVGDTATRLVVIAPSMVAQEVSFRVLVKAEDAWGNPSPTYTGTVLLNGDGLQYPKQSILFEPQHAGARWIENVRALTRGVLQIAVTDDEARLAATSNPILCSETAPEHCLVWADPHGGQLVDCEKIAGFFTHARDIAAVQFVGYQRNADVISEEDWKVQQRDERRFYQPGVFVPIPGYEWSGRTWQGGHHNVYFRRFDQSVRRNSPAEAPDSVNAQTELLHVQDVYNAYRGSDAVITPHVGGEHSDLDNHDPTLEPAVEITSTHGTFEWMLRDALQRGYRLGFLGGSDSYTGRPGDDRPGYQMRRYAKAGLTGIYANDVTIEGFIDAMRARRVFATTGARIILQMKCEGHGIGSQFTTSVPPTFSAHVVGTAPLESVELFRGLELVFSHAMHTAPKPHRIRILWNGASRMTSYSGVVWNGVLLGRQGTIGAYETIRFDSPRSYVVRDTADKLRWHAWGCGYGMGLECDVDTTGDTELEISISSQCMTGPMYGKHGDRSPRRISFAPSGSAVLNVGLAELESGPAEIELPMLEGKLTVARAHEPGPAQAQFSFTDDAPNPGINPYWLRVVQSDGEMAWSSPIFVDYVAGVTNLIGETP